MKTLREIVDWTKTQSHFGGGFIWSSQLHFIGDLWRRKAKLQVQIFRLQLGIVLMALGVYCIRV